MVYISVNAGRRQTADAHNWVRKVPSPQSRRNGASRYGESRGNGAETTQPYGTMIL